MKIKTAAILVLAFALLLIGCATPNSEMAQTMLTPGMTLAQVREIMGFPNEIEVASGMSETWIYKGHAADDYKNIALKFKDGKYVEWIPAGVNPVRRASDAMMSEPLTGSPTWNRPPSRTTQKMETGRF